MPKICKINYNPQWFDTAFNNQWNSIAQEVAKKSAFFDDYCYVKNINSSILHKISDHNLVFLGLENLATGELRLVLFSCVKMHVKQPALYAKELPECLKLITSSTRNLNSLYKSAVHQDVIAISFKTEESSMHFKQDVVSRLQPMAKSLWNHSIDTEENYLVEFSNFAKSAYPALNNSIFKLAPLSLCMQNENWIVKFKEVNAFSNLDSLVNFSDIDI